MGNPAPTTQDKQNCCVFTHSKNSRKPKSNNAVFSFTRLHLPIRHAHPPAARRWGPPSEPRSRGPPRRPGRPCLGLPTTLAVPRLRWGGSAQLPLGCEEKGNRMSGCQNERCPLWSWVCISIPSKRRHLGGFKIGPYLLKNTRGTHQRKGPPLEPCLASRTRHSWMQNK